MTRQSLPPNRMLILRKDVSFKIVSPNIRIRNEMATYLKSRLATEVLTRGIGRLLVAASAVAILSWLWRLGIPVRARPSFSTNVVPLVALVIGQVCFKALRAVVGFRLEGRPGRRNAALHCVRAFVGNLWVMWLCLFSILWYQFEGIPWRDNLIMIKTMTIFWLGVSSGQCVTDWLRGARNPTMGTEA